MLVLLVEPTQGTHTAHPHAPGRRRHRARTVCIDQWRLRHRAPSTVFPSSRLPTTSIASGLDDCVLHRSTRQWSSAHGLCAGAAMPGRQITNTSSSEPEGCHERGTNCKILLLDFVLLKQRPADPKHIGGGTRRGTMRGEQMPRRGQRRDDTTAASRGAGTDSPLKFVLFLLTRPDSGSSFLFTSLQAHKIKLKDPADSLIDCFCRA
jgi:hypothetical protein